MEHNNFINPRYHYRGSDKPEHLLFNASLQEFARQIDYIVALQTGGKISTSESYQKLQQRWETLKKAHEELGIKNG